MDSLVFERSESAVRYYCRRFPAIFARSRNDIVWDTSGRDYVDFFTAAGSLNYGHNHPAIKQALLDYIADDGIAISLDMHSSAKAMFLEKFEDVLGAHLAPGYCCMFPGPTGTNAVEAAIKLARKVTGRTRIAAFTRAFHGVTLGALAATANRGKRDAAGVALGDVDRYAFDGYFGSHIDTLALVERLLSDGSSGYAPPAAFIVETVQGEGGLNVASARWLRGLERLCRQHGSLLIVDDIQAGCGRADGFFSFEFAGIRPDIICLSKSLSGLGLPLSMLVFRKDIDMWTPGEHNGTFRGNNHAFVTAHAALKLWDDPDFHANRRTLATTIDDWLGEQVRRYGDRVAAKGRGMMRGLQLADPASTGRICTAAFEQGLIVETSGPDDEVLKIMAALTASPAHVEKGLAILGTLLAREMTAGARTGVPDAERAVA